MNKILLLAVFIVTGFSGCFSTQTGTGRRGSVQYDLIGDELVIVSASTPYDTDPAAREAYLFWFKRGFVAFLQQNVEIVTWEKSPKGNAGASGYAHGLEEAAVFYKRRSNGPESQQVK